MPADVDAEIALDVVDGDGNEQIIDVVTAEVRVAIGCNNLENAFVQLENRYVEGSSAEIVNRNSAPLLLVETIGKRCRRRLVHQAQNIKPCDPACILGRLALR